MSSMSSLEFYRDAGRARTLAENEPLFILDRGEASHVLLSIGEYRRLAGSGKRLASIPTTDAGPGLARAKTSEGDFKTVEFD